LSPDASVEDAAVQLRSVAERLASEYPATNDGLSAGITPLREYLVGGRDMTLRALLGAVVILLLAACVNVGHLVLMRWTRRRREVGIRKALGAGPGALVRDAALENVLLSVLGAGVGVAGSLFGMKVLARLAPPELLASAELRVSGPLLAMSAAIMGLAALGFTFLPARATAGVSAAGFADQKVRSEVGVRRSAAIQSFVVLQIALSSVLIFSAVLLARSFVVLRSVDTGFTSAGVLTFAVPFPDASDERSEQRARTARQITRDVGDLPGVTATGAVRRLPVIGNGWTSFFTVEGASPDAQSFEIVHRGADTGYFETMRVPIHRGRLLRTDEGDALLVNETSAAALSVMRTRSDVGSRSPKSHRRRRCGGGSLASWETSARTDFAPRPGPRSSRATASTLLVPFASSYALPAIPSISCHRSGACFAQSTRACRWTRSRLSRTSFPDPWRRSVSWRFSPARSRSSPPFSPSLASMA